MDLSIVTNYAPIVGRILIGFYFFFFVFWNSYHATAALAVMRQIKIPFPLFVFVIGLILQGVTGLLIVFNLFVPVAAALLIVFDVFATFMFHRFWTMDGPLRTLNTIIFIGNLTITLGALLLLI